MRAMATLPAAAIITLLLLLLMVKLAGLTRFNPPDAERKVAISLQLSERDFQSAPAPEPISEQQTLEPQVSELALALALALELELELELELALPKVPEELFEEAELTDLEFEPPTLPLDIELSAPTMSSIALKIEPKPKAKPKPKTKTKPKPKPKTKPKVAKVKLQPKLKVAKAINKVKSQTQPLTKSKGQATAAISAAKPSAPLYRVNPSYPKKARRRKIEGEVLVEFTVENDGKVRRNSLKILRAKPANVFDKVVLSALAKWRFPLTDTPYKLTQKLVFRLNK